MLKKFGKWFLILSVAYAFLYAFGWDPIRLGSWALGEVWSWIARAGRAIAQSDGFRNNIHPPK